MTTSSGSKEYYERNKEKLKEKHKLYREANRDKIKEKQRARQLARTEEDIIKKATYDREYYVKRLPYKMWYGAKGRAAKTGLPFNIDKEDIIIPDKCPVLGLVLTSHVKGIRDNSPTLDRKIPSLGYIKGNVSVISNLANRIKQDATHEQIIKVAEYVKTIEKGEAYASMFGVSS